MSTGVQGPRPAWFQTFLGHVNDLEVEAEKGNSGTCLGLGIERLKGPRGEGLCVCPRGHNYKGAAPRLEAKRVGQKPDELGEQEVILRQVEKSGCGQART